MTPEDFGERLLDNDRFWELFDSTLRDQLFVAFEGLYLAGIEAGVLQVQAARRTKQMPLPDADILDELPITPKDLATVSEKAIRAHMTPWLQGLKKTTRDGIKDAIILSQRNGTGVEGVLKKITPLFGPQRAKMIAVTETTRLVGAGMMASYRMMGVETWEWHTVNDKFVCNICEPRHGSEFPISTDFEPAHVLCRCFPRVGQVGDVEET